MLCQRCKKNLATEHIKEIINGKTFESHLCAGCAQEINGGLNSELNEVCSWLFGAPSPQKVCPVCHTTYADYEKTGLLGCASCYDVFKDELIPSIRAIQGKIQHVGKVDGNNDALGLHRQLKCLQSELETALKEKRFLDAGILNKRIYEISKKLYGGGTDEE